MIHSGTARSPEEHEKVRLVEVNGIRISFTSYTVPFEACRQLTSEQSAFAVNVLWNDESYRELSEHVRSARNQGADFTVVLLDFGGCSQKTADSIVKKVTDLGADLVVGNNPSIGFKDEDSVVTIVLQKENGKTIPAGGISAVQK